MSGSVSSHRLTFPEKKHHLVRTKHVSGWRGDLKRSNHEWKRNSMQLRMWLSDTFSEETAAFHLQWKWLVGCPTLPVYSVLPTSDPPAPEHTACQRNQLQDVPGRAALAIRRFVAICTHFYNKRVNWLQSNGHQVRNILFLFKLTHLTSPNLTQTLRGCNPLTPCIEFRLGTSALTLPLALPQHA